MACVPILSLYGKRNSGKFHMLARFGSLFRRLASLVSRVQCELVGGARLETVRGKANQFAGLSIRWSTNQDTNDRAFQMCEHTFVLYASREWLSKLCNSTERAGPDYQ
jgi:hypothetical protein